MRDPELDWYYALIRGAKFISAADEPEIVCLAQAGDKRARDRLVTANLRLVVKIAHRWTGYGLPLGDLVQEGNIGLVKAIDKFDPSRGFCFAACAHWWVTQSISKYVMANFSPLKIATSQTHRRLFFKLRSTLLALGIDATSADAADVLGVTEADIDDMRARMAPLSSLDDAELGLSPRAPGPSPEDEAIACDEAAHLAEALRRAMGALSSRERAIVRARFTADEPQTFDTLGRKHGVCRSRVMQIEQEALGKMRRALSSSGAA